jgi:hypothetical protein
LLRVAVCAPIGFCEYFKVGAPLTVAVIIAIWTLWLWL